MNTLYDFLTTKLQLTHSKNFRPMGKLCGFLCVSSACYCYDFVFNRNVIVFTLNVNVNVEVGWCKLKEVNFVAHKVMTS